jgi:hypothetical protein
MWDKLVALFLYLWKTIESWFYSKEIEMQKGELVVSGKNSLTIPLNAFPSETGARFLDPGVVIPCNPQDADYLECDVHTSNTVKGGFVLVITWSVSGAREIEWHASY